MGCYVSEISGRRCSFADAGKTTLAFGKDPVPQASAGVAQEVLDGFVIHDGVGSLLGGDFSRHGPIAVRVDFEVRILRVLLDQQFEYFANLRRLEFVRGKPAVRDTVRDGRLLIGGRVGPQVVVEDQPARFLE